MRYFRYSLPPVKTTGFVNISIFSLYLIFFSYFCTPFYVKGASAPTKEDLPQSLALWRLNRTVEI
jgi:hypothetical protein